MAIAFTDIRIARAFRALKAAGHQYPMLLATRPFLALFFLLFGKPACIFLYALSEIVDFDFEREVPAFLRAFIFL